MLVADAKLPFKLLQVAESRCDTLVARPGRDASKPRLRKQIEARGLKPYPAAPQLPPPEPSLPNSFAYFALFAWPAVSLVLFLMLPVERAAIWSLLGGYLLLPSGTRVDLPLLPPLDKSTIPAIVTFLFCWMKGTQSPAPQRSPLVYCCAFAFVVSPLFTSLNNSYELQLAGRSLPGFYPLDGVKFAILNVITLAPFFIGMRFLSSDNGRAQLLRAIPLAALVYSLPMLLEVRISPQLHRLVYGFFPGFIGEVRGSGYRPVVFLDQGLQAALFAATAVIAAVVAARMKWRLFSIPARAAATYLGVILLLCKTLGAAIYALIAIPMVLFLKPKAWVNFACGIGLLICAYPLLRTLDIIPVHHITSAAMAISKERSFSFAVRVENEDLLLAKANQKPAFGWGAWARNRIYDRKSGGDISITDGEWIIQFGTFGWLGYLSLFGLFTSSLLRARKAVRGPVTEPTIILGALGLLLAINLTDLLPNANLVPLTYLIAGSVAGCVRAKSSRKSARQRVDNAERAAVAA